jgi:hypothetical protein
MLFRQPVAREEGVVYLICCDSKRQTDSSRFTTYLQRTFPVYARILSSEYLVHSDVSALALLFELRKHVEPDEGLVVSEVTQNLAWNCLKVTEEGMENWEAQARDCG